MNFTLKILRSRIASLNCRAHYEIDFHRVRRKIKCGYVLKNQNRSGYYVTDISGDLIFIDAKIHGLNKLETQFHELIHALLHYPCDFLARKQQLQAEVFALVLMIPKRDLFKYTTMNFEEIDYKLIPYLKRRKYIYEVFGV